MYINTFYKFVYAKMIIYSIYRDSSQSHYGGMVNEVSVVDKLPDKEAVCDNNSECL